MSNIAHNERREPYMLILIRQDKSLYCIVASVTNCCASFRRWPDCSKKATPNEFRLSSMFDNIWPPNSFWIVPAFGQRPIGIVMTISCGFVQPLASFNNLTMVKLRKEVHPLSLAAYGGLKWWRRGADTELYHRSICFTGDLQKTFFLVWLREWCS